MEIRADSMAVRVELDEGGKPSGVTYFREGEELERFQAPRRSRYAATRSRRLGCCSTPRSRRFPNGLGNNDDQVGRYVMVQGASQSAGRFPEEQRMYKAPPPEVSSEQFYETDAARGFARGFSIQTISPLPIGWAEHVIAEGHSGRGAT